MDESRNPYISASGPSLRRSVVAYVDILGYQQMALRAEQERKEPEFLQALHKTLSEGRKWLEHDEKSHGPHLGTKDFYALKAFTDNVVIGYPIQIRDDAEIQISMAFLDLGIFQLEMIKNGFFLRGAISVGDVYIDDIAVLGNAFTEAYKGESELARDPRIVLTNSATEAVKRHLKYYAENSGAPQNLELYKDSDGQWFLNYLENILEAVYEMGPSFAELEQHKQAIEKKLSEFRARPEIWNKYFWAANYHNFFCLQYPEYFDQSHMIDIDKLQLKMERIIEERR